MLIWILLLFMLTEWAAENFLLNSDLIQTKVFPAQRFLCEKREYNSSAKEAPHRTGALLLGKIKDFPSWTVKQLGLTL